MESEESSLSYVSDTIKSDQSDDIKPNISDRNDNRSPTFRGKRLLHKTYGLRPRSTLRRILIDSDICDFKPIVCKSKNKGGDKHAPLSKYRRKTANARERHRMKDINDAFCTLRRVLPPIHTRRTVLSGMTKITTLKLAVAYIRALSEILDENGPINPSETTKTLLTAANLQIWNENVQSQPQSSNSIVDASFILNKQDVCEQIFPKSEVVLPSDNTNIDSIIPQSFTEDNLSVKRPCREQGFLPEKNLIAINHFNIIDYDLEENSGFWDDIPLLNDFQWALA